MRSSGVSILPQLRPVMCPLRQCGPGGCLRSAPFRQPRPHSCGCRAGCNISPLSRRAAPFTGLGGDWRQPPNSAKSNPSARRKKDRLAASRRATRQDGDRAGGASTAVRSLVLFRSDAWRGVRVRRLSLPSRTRKRGAVEWRVLRGRRIGAGVSRMADREFLECGGSGTIGGLAWLGLGTGNRG